MMKSENRIKIFLKNTVIGVILGFTIMIPGLSGSIIAINLKVYDKIVCVLANIKHNFKNNILFLFALFIGGIIGLLIGVFLIKIFLVDYPFYLICFFSGLMIGAYPIILNKVRLNRNILCFTSGFIVPIIFITVNLLFMHNDINLIPNNDISYNWFSYLNFFIIGIFLAITQLVPGLSATVFLMIIGYYNYFISLINIDLIYDFKLVFVIFFVFIGLLAGVLMFSKVISYLINKKTIYFNSLIAGLSLSSIICVFFNDDCFMFYKTINKLNWIYIIIICLIFIVIGILFSTILLDVCNKKRGIYEEK